MDVGNGRKPDALGWERRNRGLQDLMRRKHVRECWTNTGLALAGLAGAALLACASPPNVSHDPEADWQGYRTFGLAGSEQIDPGPPDRDQVIAQLELDVAEILAARGLTSAPVNRADLVFSITVSGQERSRETYYGWYDGVHTLDYSEGTVVIDAFDRERKRLVFHGWENRKVRSWDTDKKSEVARDAARTILAELPVPTATP